MSSLEEDLRNHRGEKGLIVARFLENTNRKNLVLTYGDVILPDGRLLQNLLEDTSQFGISIRALYYTKYEAGSFQSPQAISFNIGQSFEQLFKNSIVFDSFHDLRLLTERPSATDVQQCNKSSPLKLFSADNMIHVTFAYNKGGSSPVEKKASFRVSDLREKNYFVTQDFINSLAIQAFRNISGYPHGLSKTFNTTNLSTFIESNRIIEVTTKSRLRIAPVKDVDLTELKSFINTAALAIDKKYFSEFRNLVDSTRRRALERSNIINNPFINVLAPSGTGKTQLSFSLNQNGVPCIHLLGFRPDNDNNRIQIIYRASSDLSRCFHDQLEKDIQILDKERAEYIAKNGHKDMMKSTLDLVSTCSFVQVFQDVPLFTVGFLHFILTERCKHIRMKEIDVNVPAWEECLFSSGIDEEFPAMSPDLFMNEWKDVVYGMPIIIIDEVELCSSKKTELLYSRNLIRALLMNCVLTATSSRFTDLIATFALGGNSGSEQSDGHDSPWVFVVSKLPKVVVQGIPGFDDYVRASERYRMLDLEREANAVTARFQREEALAVAQAGAIDGNYSIDESFNYSAISQVGKGSWIKFFDWIENHLETYIPRFLRRGLVALCTYLNKGDPETKSVPEALQIMLSQIWDKTCDLKYGNNTEWPTFGQVAQLLYHSYNVLPASLVHQYQAHMLHPDHWHDPAYLEDDLNPTSNMLKKASPDLPPLSEDAPYSDFYKKAWCFPLFPKENALWTHTELGSPGFNWKECRSFFKSPSQDHLSMLGFLSYAGTKSSDLYVSKISRNFFVDGQASLFKALFKIFLHYFHAGAQNPNPLDRLTECGGLFETFVQLSFILGSVRKLDMLEGTPIPDFMLDVVRNLSKTFRPCQLEAHPDCDLRRYFRTYVSALPKIPALGPMNAHYGFLRQFLPEAMIGKIRFCKNQEQTDGRVTYAIETPDGSEVEVIIEETKYTGIKVAKNNKPLSAGVRNAGIRDVVMRCEKVPAEGRLRIIIIVGTDIKYNPNPPSNGQEAVEKPLKRRKRAKQKVTKDPKPVERWLISKNQTLFLGKCVGGRLCFKQYLAPGQRVPPHPTELRSIILAVSIRDTNGSRYTISPKDHHNGCPLDTGEEINPSRVVPSEAELARTNGVPLSCCAAGVHHDPKNGQGFEHTGDTEDDDEEYDVDVETIDGPIDACCRSGASNPLLARDHAA